MIRSTFAWPLLIAMASLFGLVVALVGDGWPDVAAWVALAVPVVATIWSVRRARQLPP